MVRVDDNDTMLVIEYRNTLQPSILDTLIKQYERYITKVQNSLHEKFSNRYTKEEIRQNIIVAFILIVQKKYNPKKGVKFRTYLMNTLKLNTLQIIRDDKWYLAPRNERLNCNNVQGFADCIVGGECLSDFEREDIIITKSNGTTVDDKRAEFNLIINSMSNLLTKEQLYIVYNCVVMEKSLKIVAGELKISINRTSKQKKIALDILKEYWSR